ncbi:MAG: hypothetical protein Q4G46_11260 [Propionibacteriaceae bacterium]|nr:hypothetical protein [Propionibacteriaceae bacterium]
MGDLVNLNAYRERRRKAASRPAPAVTVTQPPAVLEATGATGLILWAARKIGSPEAVPVWIPRYQQGSTSLVITTEEQARRVCLALGMASVNLWSSGWAWEHPLAVTGTDPHTAERIVTDALNRVWATIQTTDPEPNAATLAA